MSNTNKEIINNTTGAATAPRMDNKTPVLSGLDKVSLMCIIENYEKALRYREKLYADFLCINKYYTHSVRTLLYVFAHPYKTKTNIRADLVIHNYIIVKVLNRLLETGYVTTSIKHRVSTFNGRTNNLKYTVYSLTDKGQLLVNEILKMIASGIPV